MEKFDFYKFYSDVLIKVTPTPAVAKIMQIVMAGGETNDAFANLLANDAEIQHWVRLTVQRLGFEKQASKLEQAITLLGQSRIRDLLLGRHIERAFVKDDATILAKLLANPGGAAASIPGQEPPKAAAPPEAAKADVPADEASVEIIPPLDEFKTYLSYASQAEEVAISIRNSYPGQAFAGGVILDYVYHFLKSRDLSAITDPRLIKPKEYMDETFKDGIRSGIAANEIIQKISIPHQKNVFVTALVHNIGKPLLLAFDPAGFEKSFQMSAGIPDKEIKKIRSETAETQIFDYDHAQIGSLFVGRLPFLAEIERSIDYHHNPHLLKFSNPKLYALAAVLGVSSGLSKLYEKSRKETTDVSKIHDQRLTAGEDYAYLKLTPADWFEIKSNYALKIMKVGY